MNRRIVALASGLLFCVAVFLLHRELAAVHLADIALRLRAIPASALLLAACGTALSYVALMGYDYLALRHIGRKLPPRKVALISFVASAIGQNAGAAIVSGGAVRLRMYGALGLSAVEVGSVVALCAATFGLSVATLVGIVFLSDPVAVTHVLPLSGTVATGLGAALLGAIGAYVLWTALRRGPVRVGPFQFTPPGPGATLAQIALGAADVTFACAALYALLPVDAYLNFPLFLAIFVLALTAGTASHVPGGLGVFEAVMILSLPEMPKDLLVAVILGFRGVYYLIPLGAALVLAAGHETALAWKRVRGHIDTFQGVWEGIVPQVMAISVFVAGALLLISGSIPVLAERARWMGHTYPLPVMELSHLLASLCGVALLVLARGLARRVRAAYQLTQALLLVGAAAALGRALDWEEALLLCFVCGALHLGREAFSRPASLLDQPFTPGWTMAIAVVVAGSAWLGVFAFKHVDYANMLWWRFALDEDAPRFLRSTLAVVVLVTGWGLWRLLRPAPPPPAQVDAAQLDRAAAIVAAAPDAMASLALLGDKRLLFGDGGDGFVMYQVQGRSWIAMGDPVAPPHRVAELAWRFRETCDHHGGRPVFYEVGTEYLPVYLDQGLAPVKIGEEAWIPLAGFSLEGSARAWLRQGQRKIQRAGGVFEIVPAPEVAALLPELKAVSDAWLADKATREKGFSVGRFDPAYLCRFPCAVLRVEGRIVAFANLWLGAERREMAMDLMRYAPDAPKGVMDFLFAELLLWGAAEGYGGFSLGMAPLAGLEAHALAPMWHRIGTTVFEVGGYFYNFEGLRAYKNKFDPVWRPRYLVAQRGLALPTALLDVAALIGGGVRGVLTK